MGDTVASLLPLAVVIAVSPVPILAVVLMLLAARPDRTGPGFVVGWVLGIAGVTTLVLLLAGPAREDGGDSSAVGPWAALVAGTALVPLAVRQWRARPGTGVQPPMPRWAAAIDQFTAVRAGGLGLALSALNPKAVVACIAAGTAIASGGLSGTQTAWSVVAFTAVAASTVTVPVLAYGLGHERMAGSLDALRTWLTAHNAVVTAALLLVIGVALIGQGLSSLT